MTYRNVVEHASHAIGKASIFINFSNSEHERTSIHEYIRLFFYFFFFFIKFIRCEPFLFISVSNPEWF